MSLKEPTPKPSRACTMCGMPERDCMKQLAKKNGSSPCCAICHDGDTHPSAEPDRELTCAQWGELHGGDTEEHTAESLAKIAEMREKYFGEGEAA